VKAYRIVAFGVTRELIGRHRFEWNGPDQITAQALKNKLLTQFPELGRLRSLALADSRHVLAPDEVVTNNDEVVLIPPVSGG
jgi:molybdopterin synthase sulfur carrier subunit